MLVQLSSYVTIPVALQQTCKNLCSYFLWLTYSKSEVELSSQQKVIIQTAVEETVVEGLLVERSANEKLAVEGSVAKETVN